MLDVIVSSETRVKLLIKFFLNNGNRSYLKELEKDYGVTKHILSSELANLEKAGLLMSETESNRRYYTANHEHPFYNEIVSIVRKSTGIDQIIRNVISRAGDLKSAWITGNFARGIDSDTIELVLEGHDIDTNYIDTLVKKAEKIINRKIICVILQSGHAKYFLQDRDTLLIWTAEE